MFTGIITDIGRIAWLEQLAERDTRLHITTRYPLAHLGLGDSIACDGICLTVVAAGETDADTRWFEVEASAETLSRTTLGQWQENQPINLERALALGDVLGGHLVSGHVDGVGRIAAITPENDSHRWEIEAPAELLPYLAEKGSITVDGASLTVNAVDGNRFFLNLIPHTLTHTSFGTKQVGDAVNLEIDLIARYVGRMLATRFATKD
jgi:riboflavin synthase